jgi:tetratricopeptide (TPR) repeat protein
MAMNKLVVALFAFVLIAQVTMGQGKDYQNAYMSFKNYIDYDKTDKKTESLGKARESIDKAVDAIKAQQAAADSKLKDATVAKVYNQKSRIYVEMSLLPDENPLSKGAAGEAFDAIETANKYDKKGEYKNDYLFSLQVLYSKIFNAGADAFKAKDYNTAYQDFEKASRLTTMQNSLMGTKGIDTAAIQSAAISASNAKNTDKAIELYEILISAGVKDEMFYQALMDLYNGKGDKDKANDVMNRAKVAFPNSNAFIINEINALLAANKKDEALAKMQKATELYPDNATLFFALGTNFEAIKTPEMQKKAEDSYLKAISVDPKYFDALYNLGAFYYNIAAEKIKAANALDLSKQKEYDALVKEAGTWFNKSLPYFERGLEQQPNDVGTLLALKEVYAQLNNPTKSAEYKKRYDALPKK